MVFVDSVLFSFASPPFVSSHCSLIHHGRRLIQLPKLRRLSVSVKPEKQNESFSSAASAVDSLSLTTKLAESISRKVRSEGKGNPDSVLQLLKSYGFTDSQIANIIKDYPGLLLIADPEKSIGPKLKFLQSRGASTSELTEVLSKVPKILIMRFYNAISIYYDFVKEIIEADKSSSYVKLCQSLEAEGSAQENIFRNVLVLRELGVSQKNLFSLLISGHSHVCGKERFEESLKKVVEMGFDPTSSKFVKALQVVYQMSDKAIEEKVNNLHKRLGLSVGDVWEIFKTWPAFLALSEKNILNSAKVLKSCGLLEDEVLLVLKKFPWCFSLSEQKILNSVETLICLGFSRDEVTTIVKRFPTCLNYSAESVKKKIEFLVKKMNWPLKPVVSYPVVLGLSMDKRIVPRCNVIRALMSKELLKGNELPAMGSVFACTDKDFLKRYVRKHDDKELVTELMSIFTGEDRVS